MTRQKRIAAIHDISGFGKCSLTVVLPIVSAAGIETSVIPTAVLSTHTGGIEGYTFHDLTSDMPAISKHWQSLDLKFDALYSGYLGSNEQLQIVSDMFKAFKQDGNLIMVDPVMADNGILYPAFDQAFAYGMRDLCKQADIVVPNITEACFMLDIDYKDGPYDEAYIKDILVRLCDLGPGKAVLTGVNFDNDHLGAAVYDAKTGTMGYASSDKIEGYYHGTGDVFGSALLSALLNGFDLQQSARIAVNFTTSAIRRTKEAGTDLRFGVDFERALPGFMKDLNLL